MGVDNEHSLNNLLNMIRPWFDQEQAFLIDMAKQQWSARIVIALALLESERGQEAALLLESIIEAPASDDSKQQQAKIRALLELAYIRMEQYKYDEAEALLWQAREGYTNQQEQEFSREDISLLIAQSRFGQGFVQDAIERAEEVFHKLQSIDAGSIKLAKVHQQLGWFYLHKMDVPKALTHIRKAMKLAPQLDQSEVDKGLKAEKEGNFEKALEYYFDSIVFDS